MHRRHAILAAGLLVLAATAAALIVTLPENDRPRPPPIGNGVASIGATEKHVGTFTAAAMAPSNVAVGEGAVWALSTEVDTISRIDARTGRVVKSFQAGTRPSDIAAGGGAIWVGDGSGQSLGITARILRVDPDSGAITRVVKLPKARGGAWEPPGPPSLGFPQIAVGAGAVWARNPDGTVSRIDPKTGERETTIKTGVAPSTIAAGKEGVWFLRLEPTCGLLYRPADESGRPAHPGRQRRAVGHRSGRRLGVGDLVPGRAALADRAGTAPARALDPRRGQRGLRRLRGRRGVDCGLRQWDGHAGRSANEQRRGPVAGGREPVAGGRRRRGVGQRRGGDAGRQAAGVDLFRGGIRGHQTGRADRLGSAVAGSLWGRGSCYGGHYPLRPEGPRLSGGQIHGRVPVL